MKTIDISFIENTNKEMNKIERKKEKQENIFLKPSKFPKENADRKDKLL